MGAAGPTGAPAGRRASEEPAAGGCPVPLPRPSHKGAQGPRFLLAPPSRPGPVCSVPVSAARTGLWAAAPAGVVRPVMGRGEGARYPPDPRPPQPGGPAGRLPSPLPRLPPGPGHRRRLPCRPHPPGRPGGSVTPRPWPSAGSLVSPPPLRCGSQREKGRGPSGGGGRWDSRRTHLFFFSPPTPPPTAHTRKGFPDTLVEVPQFPETGRDHFRWGKSHLSGASRVALGPRPAGRDGQGTVSGRGYGLGKGPLPEPPASSLFLPGCPQLLFLLLMLRTVPPRPRGSLSASQLPPARPEDSIHSWRI